MRKYLSAAFLDNGLVEIRAIGDKIYSGIFDDQQKMFEAVREINKGQVKGIYILLNAIKLRHATNRIDLASKTVTDSDIVKITRLPFDFDAVRETNTSSTSDELSEARAKCMWLRKWLRLKGWPDPLVAMSGNGYHLQYRTALKPDDELKLLLKDLYNGLDLRCSNEAVSFDKVVRNPSRIFRLYGTTARKGKATAERPHRVARCKTPDDWGLLSLDQIKSLVDEIRPPKKVVKKWKATGKKGRGDYRTLDVVSWFSSNGFYKRNIMQDKHAVICPWHNEHTNESDINATDTVIWEASTGWPTFHCSHSHCQDRTIRDVIEFFGDADKYCGKNYA